MASNLDTESIIVSIKKMLGLGDDYTPFDMDVIVHINSAFMKLTQLGVGPREGFVVTDYDKKWSDFLTNPVTLGAVKNYVYLQVKMIFDPPTNSYVMDALKQQADELGWRLNVQAESVEDFDFMHNEKAVKETEDQNESSQTQEAVTSGYIQVSEGSDSAPTVSDYSATYTAQNSSSPEAITVSQITLGTPSLNADSSSSQASNDQYSVEGETLNLFTNGFIF